MGNGAGADTVRLGVLGAGNIADMNVAGYLEHPAATWWRCATSTSRSRPAAAERWGVPRVYTDLDDLLADDDIDAVEILTPTHLHYDHIIAALARRQARLGAEADHQHRRRGPRARSSGRASGAHPAGERVLRPLPAARAGQEAHRRRGHRPAHRACASARSWARPTPSSRPPCAPRATAGASTSAAPAATSSTTWSTSTPWPCGSSTRTSSRSRPWCGAATSSSSPAPCIFEYEDPDLLGTMEVQYAREHVDALELLRRRRVLRGAGRTRASCG